MITPSRVRKLRSLCERIESQARLERAGQFVHEPDAGGELRRR